jgi:hypothetical protein
MSDLYRFTTPTTLDEWPTVRDFWAKFRSSQWGHRIPTDKEAMERIFFMSLAQPAIHGLLLGWQGDALRGVIVLQQRPWELESGLVVPTGYIAGAFIDPRMAFTGFADRMCEFMVEWAKVRGQHHLHGNGRKPEPGKNNYKLDALFQRYGFQAEYMVVVKKLAEV